MLSSNEPNIVRRQADLAKTLKEVLADPERFLPYNRELSERIKLQSMPEIAAKISQHAMQAIEQQQDRR